MAATQRRGIRDRRLMSKAVETDRRQGHRRAQVDRRTATRVPIDLWMEEVRGDEVYFRRSCNLSEGGVFFEQSIPHPVGTRVTLRFTLPGENREIVAHGDVVSAARVHDGLGMGVKFESIDGDGREVLRRFIGETLQHRAAHG
jgi:uncharacterized protein (TIGR02266 family)